MTWRALHVIGSSQFGGIVPYVVSLVRMAREHGGDAEVLATDPRVVAYLHERGVSTVRVNGIDRPVQPFRDAVAVIRTTRHMRHQRYEVVHTHTSKGGIVGRAAARLARVPVIIHTTQGYAFSDYATNGAARSVFRKLEQLATRWCDFIIAANEADRLMAVETSIVSPAKIVTIPNGLDIDDADAQLAVDGRAVARELGLDPARPIVGAMGRLVPQKGMDVFIDAIPAIAAALSQAQFVIVGSGELEEVLRARANAIGAPVVLAGHRPDWYRMLAAMTVFVMPSRWEGLPITLLGAMAARLPIVATRIKGIVDVCAGAEVALLVEADRSDEIATAVITLLGDPARRGALGSNARAHLENEFSDRVMTARTWKIYDAVAKLNGISLQ